MDLESLKLLEDRVELVLAQHSALGKERDRLHKQLGEAESRLEGMRAQLQRYEKERAEMKARLERIMSRLEGLGVD